MNHGYWNRILIRILERTLADHRARFGSRFKEFEQLIEDTITEYREDYNKTVALIERIKNPVQRQVYQLHFIEGKTYEEIADIMFYSVKTVNMYGRRPIDIDKDNNNR